MKRLTNPQAEHALLVRMLLEPDTIANVVTELRVTDFSEERNAAVYRAIRERHLNGQPVDSIVIEADTGINVDVLDLPIGSRAPVEEYVKALRDAAARRDMVQALDLARDKIVSTEEEPVTLVEEAVDRIMRSKNGVIRTPQDVADSYRSVITSRPTRPDGLPFGLKGVDKIMVPATPGRLIMIASRPSVGKTSLAEHIADNWATYGPVLFVSLEMSEEELMDRAVARASGISVEEIMRGRRTIEELEPFIADREKLPIIYDEKSTTMGAIQSAASRIKLAYGGELAGIIIDYIQLVAGPGDEEVYRIGKISHEAKRLAKRMECPVIALAQFSRRIEQDTKPRAPKLSDLRDSGVLEQDADAVIALIGNPGESQREAHILKQRQGKTGVIPLSFDGEHSRWVSHPSEAPEAALSW